MNSVPKALFLVGPTATGKSDLAMQVCAKWGGEIVNADSIQVYKGFDIGSAKPSMSERELLPHHLFDFVSPEQNYTAGDYRKDALKVLEQAQGRGLKHLVFVGGSGFYIRALLQGMWELPKTSENVQVETQKRIEKMGWESAYSELVHSDPEYAGGISPNDHYRIQRALEVIAETQSTVTEVRKIQSANQSFPYAYKAFAIDVDRESLRSRVIQRTQKMLDLGWVDEVKHLISEGYEESTPMKSVGYLEVCQFLRGELSEDELIEKVVTSTMQLAKKQRTWFRHQTPAQLIDPEALDVGLQAIEEFLLS